MPKLFGDLFREIIARLDVAWPIDGIGIKFTDGKGGRSGNLFGVNPIAANEIATPLKLISANDGAAKGSIIYGTVKGMDVIPAATAVSDGDHGWVQIVTSYDAATGIWSYGPVSLHFGGTVPVPDATNMYLSLGMFSVSGVTAKALPALTGSQDCRRCGTSAAFTDAYGKQ